MKTGVQSIFYLLKSRSERDRIPVFAGMTEKHTWRELILDSKVEKIIKEEAEKKGLEKGSGVKGKEKRKKTLYHDLDHLSGVWTKAE